MRTISVNLYEFSELSETAKQKVLSDMYDINANYDWWESTYEDAERVGLTLDGFDLYRGGYCNGSFNLSPCEVAANIFNEHGESCKTYKAATKFMNQWQPVFNSYMDESSENYESRESEDLIIEMESEFLKDLLNCYLSILRDEYEYQVSDEAIIETIESNEYEFTEDGHHV